MAFDSNGTFNRLFSWATDKLNGVSITASRMDGEDNGFAAGLTNCVTRDGLGKMGADFLPGSDNAFNLGSLTQRWASFNGVPAVQVTYLNKVKAATSSITNNFTQLVDDSDLQLVLPPGTYQIAAQLFFNGTATGDQGAFFGLHFSGTCTTASWSVSGTSNGLSFNPIQAGITGANQTTAQNYLPIRVSPFLDSILMTGVIPVTVQGLLAVSWCQGGGTHGSNATNLLLNSSLMARRIA